MYGNRASRVLGLEPNWASHPAYPPFLPEGQPALQVTGVVRHVRADAPGKVAGLGIEFEALPPEVEEWIASLL
jgi:hypothetical protein